LSDFIVFHPNGEFKWPELISILGLWCKTRTSCIAASIFCWTGQAAASYESLGEVAVRIERTYEYLDFSTLPPAIFEANAG
jgi:hypothetical protein